MQQRRQQDRRRWHRLHIGSIGIVAVGASVVAASLSTTIAATVTFCQGLRRTSWSRHLAQGQHVATVDVLEKPNVGVKFEPGSVGFAADMESGKIIEVLEGQAAKQGVRPGWMLFSLDGEPYQEDLLYSKMDGNKPYQATFVTFDDQDGKWLPPLDRGAPDMQPSKEDGLYVAPLFVLGSMPFYPGLVHKMDITERRYQMLHDDVLSTESRTFVVTPTSDFGNLQRIGAIFRIKKLGREIVDLQEIYQCEYEIVGRVTIQRVLNPSASESGSTYLKAEVAPLEDIDADTNMIEEEAKVMASLRGVEKKLLEMKNVGTFYSKENSASRTGGLWKIVDLWIKYLEDRKQNTMTEYMHYASVEFKRGDDESKERAKQLKELFLREKMVIRQEQKSFATWAMELKTHRERLQMMCDVLVKELERLTREQERLVANAAR